MTFSQLTSGANVHVLEITGTFKKNTTYSLGTIVSVSQPYDEPLQPTQFPMPMQNRRKLVDLVISCDGEQKKISVPEGKNIITDSAIGLTVSTDKDEIINMVRRSYNDYKIKKESLSRLDDEMKRCEDILKMLKANDEPVKFPISNYKEFFKLQDEVKQLKEKLQNMDKHEEIKEETQEEPEKETEN